MAENENINPDPGKFNSAKEQARLLAEEMDRNAKAGRDLSDEVKKLTKDLYGASEAAAEINKAFRDSSRSQRTLADGMLDILDGRRKEKDILKDIQDADRNLNKLKGIQVDLLKKAGADKTQLDNLKKGEKIQFNTLKDFSKLSDKEKQLLRLSHEKIKNQQNTNQHLQEQLALVQKGNTALVAGMEAVSGIADRLGMGFLSEPLNKGAEAARLAAIAGEGLAGQLSAAAVATQGLLGRMILLSSVTAGLKFDEQSTNLRRDFGITRNEARGIRREFSGLAGDIFSIGDPLSSLLITSKDIGEAVANLNKQFGAGGALLRDDVVQEMARLAKFTNLSEESQGNFARFINISGKNARAVTREARRAVVTAEAEKGLRLDINKTLDKAGKINGQISAQLGGNVVELTKAVAVANQFGMELEQVAKAGDALLNFEQSINAELEAELLTGKQLNLERARLAALTGDYETLTREINANVGDFGDFTKMNVLQQRALAQSVGMTADELSNVLLEQANIDELAKEARLLDDDKLAKQLESISAQQKFNMLVDKVKTIFVDIVGGPLSDVLSVLGSVLSMVTGLIGMINIGGSSLFSYVATAFILVKAFKMIRNSVLFISGIFKSLIKSQTILNALTFLRNKMHQRGLVLQAASNRRGVFSILRAAGAAILNAMAAGFKAPFPVGPILGAALGVAVGATAATLIAKYSKGDDVMSPGYGKRTLMMPEGAIALNDKDTVIAGTNLTKGDDIISRPAGTFTDNSSDIIDGLKEVVSSVKENSFVTAQNKPDSIFASRGQNNGSVTRGSLKHGTVGDSDMFA